MTVTLSCTPSRSWQRICAGVLSGWILGILTAQAQTPAPAPGRAAASSVLAVESVGAAVHEGSEVVRIDFNRALDALPASFAIQSPARIAIDVPGAANAMGRQSVDIQQGTVRSVQVVQTDERTRFVINLKAAVPYALQLQGRSLLVALDRSVAASPSPRVQAPLFAESRNREALPIKDLDFRRGADSSGRVIIDLASSQVGVDIRPQGQNLVVDLLNSRLPEGLRRRLDVADFATPVQAITAQQVGERVRLVIEPRGAWEHSAYQSDTQLVVEVRPQRPGSGSGPQAPAYTGEKLSLNFQNIEVRALLQVIADFTNFNVVTSESVAGSLTLRLRDVPWDQALDIILQAKGLGMRKSGNVLWIAPKEEIATKEKLELEARAALQGLEPLRTQAFQLNYTKAAEIAAQLTAGPVANRILSSRGSVIAEPRTNQLFVTDIGVRLEAVQSLLSKLDIAVRQVLIEARIVEASDTFGKSLGVRLGGQDLRGVRGAGTPGVSVGGGGRIALGASYNAVTGTTGETPPVGGGADTRFVNLPAIGLAGFAPASFAISLFSSSANRFLDLELTALEADGKGKLVSSPRIVTADQTKALIEQGTEFPYQQATSSGATAVAFRRATLKLEVTPQITPEGNIILDLDINKDSRGETTAAGIAINTKHIRTQVLVENGGTVVIGGIFELTETENEARVPLLGDLPAVGNLFKNRQRSSNKQEMLVFITPKVITERPGVR
ncbi:MAG: putative Fimbrial assembly protein pilQ precursor, secretin family [Pseudomonadota bacterium]